LRRLVVVSNRVGRPRPSTAGEGGLAVAMRSALKEYGGLWFGWSGNVAESDPSQPTITHAGSTIFATLDLTQRDYREYYYGYGNRTLWPLFHYRLDLTELSRRDFAGYQRVNTLFAHHLVSLLTPDDVIWVHDYHLIPMAEQLRHMGINQRIGFFLHIPWPPLQILLALPNHHEIVRALSAYDLVGFQTAEDVRAFCEYIEEEAGGRVSDGTVTAFGRTFQVGAFPISIDTEEVAEFARNAAQGRQVERLAASLHGRVLVIGVDRLDYSKGIVQRFEAFEHLLRSYPENLGHVVLMQIAPPSRADVPEYAEIRHSLEMIAGRINGAYAEFDWAPVRYLNKGFSRKVLMGFLRSARVGLVTPLRDGMNLVAKEYVASQNPDDPGVLVLSRFAGAARELDSALIVNPYDIEDVGEALQRALTMSIAERKDRWRRMMNLLRKRDVTTWRQEFLNALAARVPA
jgi:trehalose 6-phosphate synthase